MDLSNRLDRLGRAVSEVSDRLADPKALDLARRRFLNASAVPRGRVKARALVALAAAACFALALLGVGAVVSRAPPGLSFEVGVARAHGTVGDWIAATGGEPLPLRFSEGTALTLEPGAQVRVTETTASGAAVLIEQGMLDASVVHAGRDTHWTVLAGPYQVRVTGTRFRAGWDPATETFDLVMEEGAVVVSGPLVQHGRVCTAGERLRASPRDGRLELRSPKSSSLEPSPAAVPPSSEAALPAPADAPAANTPAPEAPGALASARGAASASAPPAESTWRALFAASKYKEAFAAADRAGFANEIARASTADLLALADVARYGGRPAEAREALVAARSRGARGRSAFLLGKVAADQGGSPGEAVTWFETYLREEPGGPLAEQALGRVMELRRRDPAVARSVAERYLAAYPHGAYSTLAQRLLAPRDEAPSAPR